MADISVDPWSWSSTAASNQPAGTTAVGTGLDDNLRAIQAGAKASMEPLSGVTGTNTVAATFAGLSAYATGQRFWFVPANSNTGAMTLNVTSLGAKNIFLNAAALVGYEIRANQPVQVYYDGTQFNIVSGAHGDGTPIARISDSACATAPSGHLLCDGSNVSRSTYADLFAVLSTTWGAGNGSTTFGLPDSRRRTSVGSGGSGTGTLGNAVGNTGGEEAHALSIAELAAHTHPVPGDAETGVGGIVVVGATAATLTGVTASTGNGTAHNTMQPSYVVTKIIKF